MERRRDVDDHVARAGKKREERQPDSAMTCAELIERECVVGVEAGTLNDSVELNRGVTEVLADPTSVDHERYRVAGERFLQSREDAERVLRSCVVMKSREKPRVAGP